MFDDEIPDHLHGFVRCSSLPWIAACEDRYIWEYDHPDYHHTARPLHVASWIGTAVHSRILGGDYPEVPKHMTFDSTTQSLAWAERQTDLMAEAVADAIKPFRVIDTEVELYPWREPEWEQSVYLAGRADMIARDEENKLMLVDIKTGNARNMQSWLQLGAYVLLSEQGIKLSGGDYLRDPKFDILTIVHTHRPDMPDVSGKPPETSIFYMSPRAAKDAAARVVARISDLRRNPEHSYPSPGLHCGACPHPTCAARAVDTFPSQRRKDVS